MAGQRGRVGLIAGSGRLPLLFAQALSAHAPEGRAVDDVAGGFGAPFHLDEAPIPEVVAVGHEGETDAALIPLVASFRWVRLGQFRRIVDFFLRHEVRWVVMAGGITKSRIWRARPDFLALKMVLNMRHMHDDLLLRTAASMLEVYGFGLKSVTDFVPELLASHGVLSRRRPTSGEWADVRFGWQAAKALGRLDIGQGVVVRHKMVAAVEAMEGTDAMIQRAGPLIAGKGWAGRSRGGGVLVKVSKPMQDRRLDLPTVGPNTMRRLHQAGLSVIAIEAGGTMIVEPEETCALADRFNLVFMSCVEQDMRHTELPDPQGSG